MNRCDAQSTVQDIVKICKTSFTREAETRGKSGTIQPLFPCPLLHPAALCAGYMFIANGGRQVERKVTSRINRAKTDLFIVLFPQLSRKRMHKLENASRGKNTLEILKLPRFVCIPVAALHVKILKLLSSLVISFILAANGTSLFSVKVHART